MNITNRDRFPGVDFLDEPREIGFAGEYPLLLLGREEGTEIPLVAIAYPDSEELHAALLYELLSHSGEPISIPDPL